MLLAVLLHFYKWGCTFSSYSQSRSMSFNFPKKSGTGISSYLRHTSKGCADLILKMCSYDPDDRHVAISTYVRMYLHYDLIIGGRNVLTQHTIHTYSNLSYYIRHVCTCTIYSDRPCTYTRTYILLYVRISTQEM